VNTIGIDPGIARTGYAVIERVAGSSLSVHAVGVIRTSAGTPHARRLVELRHRLIEIVSQHRPTNAAIERLFFNTNVRTAMAVGQAAGVVLATLAELGIEPAHYTPLEVKQSVVGVGNASKQQVQSMVAAILKLHEPPRPADAADACALAICHLNRSGLASAIKRAAG
jgi:crossover junction endodeoxyribonuclease RuvC